MLEVKDLSFSYDGTSQVLDSLDFNLDRGELVLLTGSTGSGKSTLAKFISGFIPRAITGQCSGRMFLDGEDLYDWSLSEISQLISLVQQDPESQICTLRVSDEVAFGPENYLITPDEIIERVQSKLSDVGALHLKERPTYALSGGEKQRTVIAAVLACQPEFIIFDEPSASLDPKGVLRLRSILGHLKEKGLGILCIEHHHETVLPVSDRVLRLQDGRISEIQPQELKKGWGSVKTRTMPEPGRPLLIANGVSFAYEKKEVIHKVSVSIGENELIALMGGNGSGKTTLVGLLSGLLEPNEGRVFLNDSLVAEMKPIEVASKIAVVFQNPNHQIFENTVWEEHTLALEILDSVTENRLKAAEDALREFGLESMKERNPFSLSHGQKRRLNVSSTTVHDPLLYLFDEPFIGQDMEGRDAILAALIDRTSTGGAAVVVTHDSKFVEHFCDRVIFMESGNIALDGTPQSVFQQLRQTGRSEYTGLEVDLR